MGFGKIKTVEQRAVSLNLEIFRHTNLFFMMNFLFEC